MRKLIPLSVKCKAEASKLLQLRFREWLTHSEIQSPQPNIQYGAVID